MCSCSLWYNCYIYHFAWDACTTRCWWKLLYFSIYGRGTPKIHHNRGKWGLLCKMRTKWGPFQQFGPHEDQVLNWGPFRTHCARLALLAVQGCHCCSARLALNNISAESTLIQVYLHKTLLWIFLHEMKDHLVTGVPRKRDIFTSALTSDQVCF